MLNACYSKTQAEAIHQHIDYVVGMNQAIEDIAAIEFAVGFYDALGAGRPYEDCFKVSCASIDLEGIPESETPVLKARQRQQFSINEDKSIVHEQLDMKTNPQTIQINRDIKGFVQHNSGTNSTLKSERKYFIL